MFVSRKSLHRATVSALTVAVLLAASAPAALAYGPEGMFGGRPNPDGSVQLQDPVYLKNDRPERAEMVLDHPRPDYDPVPIDVGSFALFPSLEVGENFDSNVYATSSNEKTDFIHSVRPVMSAFSNWGRHAVAVTAFGDINFYSDHTKENYQNAVADASGRYDFGNKHWLSARAGYQHLTEARWSPDAINGNGSEPTTFNMGKAGVSYFRGVGKVSLSADYDYRRYDYNDTPSPTGKIDQSYRNRNEHEIGTKVGYSVSPNFMPYVKAGYHWRDFDESNQASSQGYKTLVGTTFDFGGITSLDLFAGWLSEGFDHTVLHDDVTTPVLGGRLEWNVTGLTSVVFEVNRTIETTTLSTYNSYIATGGSATVTHELLRNVLVEGDFSMTRDDFQGEGTRMDTVYSTGGGVRYLINRNFYTDLVYNWTRRNSNEDNVEYGRHLASLRLGMRM